MAGLAELLLGKSNPFAQFVNENQNKVHAAFGGLGSGTNFNEGLSRAAQGASLAAPLDQVAAEKRQLLQQEADVKNKTAAYLRAQPGGAQFADAIESGAIDGSTAFKSWMDASKGQKPIEINGQLVDPTTMKVLGDFRTVEGKGGNAEVALQPTWLQDAAGNWVIGQLSKDGSIVQTKLPEGMTPADPGTVAGSRAGATVDAKTAAAARAALPGAEQMMTITNKAIADVRANAKGMNEWFGQVGPRGVYVNPGSEMGKFIAASSPTNAQAFMQARNMLKGGGQITDYEGRRAEDAISRMQAALDRGDLDQYLRAVADFEQAVADGYAKLQATAGGAYTAPALGVPQGAGNTTSTGVTWSVSP